MKLHSKLSRLSLGCSKKISGRILLGALLSFVVFHVEAAEDPLAALKKDQPKDVVIMIDRIVGCSHWAGEEPYDRERRDEILAAMKSLKCKRLDRDVAALEKRYAKQEKVIEVLKEAKGWSY
ncbi:hypothetical protein RF679_13250 [Undibacterium cyanobacteriorum]|uniref:HEAT repeat domain-containing protein n=1 Tax=Undibacterium cyanobacteriorum TaxID=3073561 RepID=A0ABY9REF9_9BURK|nr:hypothetical protein [Undibacterium sp. 20NA77.5]WMW79612.1 hypothetical protein RF679_13250 [Undibacterium sp. 20NA77.5]